jgi:hypothetical protein
MRFWKTAGVLPVVSWRQQSPELRRSSHFAQDHFDRQLTDSRSSQCDTQPQCLRALNIIIFRYFTKSRGAELIVVSANTVGRTKQ